METRLLTQTSEGAWLIHYRLLHPAEGQLAAARSDLGDRFDEIEPDVERFEVKTIVDVGDKRFAAAHGAVQT